MENECICKSDQMKSALAQKGCAKLVSPFLKPVNTPINFNDQSSTDTAKINNVLTKWNLSSEFAFIDLLSTQVPPKKRFSLRHIFSQALGMRMGSLLPDERIPQHNSIIHVPDSADEMAERISFSIWLFFGLKKP